MRKPIVWCVLGISLAAGGAGRAQAQAQREYIDLYIAKVKPEKRAAYEAAIKKLIEANRANKGDTWIAVSPAYGEQMETIYFASARVGMSSIEPAMELFEKSVGKAYGQAGAMKLFQDLGACTSETHGELRVRRPDLSVNFPESAADRARLIGASRWIALTTVWLRPGKLDTFIDEAKAVKRAIESGGSGLQIGVSQAITGPLALYFARYVKSLADLETGPASLAQVLGPEAYQKLQQVTVDCALNSRRELLRVMPELSNPPEQIVDAAPDFWKPKPPPPPKPKAAPAEKK
jgi:quinol monooxygenase YgiN